MITECIFFTYFYVANCRTTTRMYFLVLASHLMELSKTTSQPYLSQFLLWSSYALQRILLKESTKKTRSLFLTSSQMSVCADAYSSAWLIVFQYRRLTSDIVNTNLWELCVTFLWLNHTVHENLFVKDTLVASLRVRHFSIG